MTRGRSVAELADYLRARKREFRLLDQAEYVTATELIRRLASGDDPRPAEQRLAEIRTVLDALDLVTGEGR